MDVLYCLSAINSNIFFIYINDFKILLVYVTFVDDSFTNEEFINT